ncbi:MAG: hypothetical protein WCS42_24980 [Verrucomicrobiota bacterium]
MMHILTSLLALFFSLSCPAMEANAVFCQSSLAANATAHTFTSADPLVANLANKIESLYPGHVVGVNVPLRNAAGNLMTDADILLQSSVLQVKSGGSAQGLLRQLQRSEAATGLPSIGFGPNLPANSLRTLSQQGGLVTGNENLLLQVIKP